MANNLALFTFNLLKIQKVQLAYSASSFSLFFVHFTFFWFNFIFILFISLFFWCTFIYLFYISNTTSAVYMFHLRSLILMYCVYAFVGFYVSAWVRCICVCVCVCVSCVASTDVNFNLSLYINPSIHRTAYTSQRLPLFTLLFNFCIALTLKGWTECDGESVTMRYR